MSPDAMAAYARIMDDGLVDRWFAGYLEGFGAVARGEREVIGLLRWYAVPLTITLDDAVVRMTTPGEVVAVVGRQLEHLKAEGFAHSAELSGQSRVLNGSTALRREELVRQRADDSMIDRVDITYLIVGSGDDDLRITLMAVHGSGG